MGAKVEGFAKQYETKVQETTAAIEKLSDADWKKVTEAERWPVGVTAHHVAGAHEPIANIVKTLADGQSVPHFTMQMLDEMNAKHAVEHAGCTKAETIALHKQGAAKAAAMLRTLSDEQLAKSGTVFTGAPPMTAEEMVSRALIGHMDEHFGSIRKTIGN
jgi:isocitrate dehydrogenase kinase/phosphatase